VILSSSAGKNGGSRQAKLSQYAILAASSGDSALSRARESILVAGFLPVQKKRQFAGSSESVLVFIR